MTLQRSCWIRAEGCWHVSIYVSRKSPGQYIAIVASSEKHAVIGSSEGIHLPNRAIKAEICVSFDVPDLDSIGDTDEDPYTLREERANLSVEIEHVCALASMAIPYLQKLVFASRHQLFGPRWENNSSNRVLMAWKLPQHGEGIIVGSKPAVQKAAIIPIAALALSPILTDLICLLNRLFGGAKWSNRSFDKNISVGMTYHLRIREYVVNRRFQWCRG